MGLPSSRCPRRRCATCSTASSPGSRRPPIGLIIERADGIPLYAVETVRVLSPTAAWRRADGVYVPTGDLTSLAIPDTLTALIAARLDALDPLDRGLLLDAAVLGQSFTPAASRPSPGSTRRCSSRGSARWRGRRS